ncbi:hypothetical protein AX16_003145 [Volvariella volvacea WC 439]|nr:hypothetical protein AX16_003145 [Volvariella volvacea WC 439]
MAQNAQRLEALITSLVPKSRDSHSLKQELYAHCHEVLNSNIGQHYEPSLTLLTDSISRKLLQASNDTASNRFANLVARLLAQPALSRKEACIAFLNKLSSVTQARLSPSYLPSLTIPPPIKRPQPSGLVSSSPQGQKPRGLSKAEILHEYRSRIGRPHIPEGFLLRDTLYLLQGISGKYVRFSLQDQEGGRLVFVDETKYLIPPSTKVLLHRLAEVGYLYARVDAYVREREGGANVGMIEQSLCHHLHNQLTEYYRLIAVLESQMVSNDSINDLHTDTHPGREPPRENGLTLRRLDVWIDDWRLRLRMMSVCVEGARGAHGGALVNLIHSYTDNGDPFVRRFTDQLLEEVSKPFFSTLHKWLFSGELYDPFLEFFVAINNSLAPLQYVHPSYLAGAVNTATGDNGTGSGLSEADDLSGERESGLHLWENKYQFQENMLPMFVGLVFGRKIFSTGKSLNFIRYSCHDSDWVATREKMSNTGGTLQYSDIAGLERSIDSAYQIASQRLFEIFVDKFKLMDHLAALKNYLMLGYGDFADQLMDALLQSLARPANTLYRHNLTATLETAIRSSTAQNDPPGVLRRLDARVLEYSHGEIGWDVFTLEYKVDPPIDTVLDPNSMEQYLKIFKHLWQMKRIEGALNRGWVRVAGGARTFVHLPDFKADWHKIRLMMSEMIHFVRQLQAYCHVDVIECSWKVLTDFFNKKEGDLDAMIEAHRSYLGRIVKKVLLLTKRPGREENILESVRAMFALILQFREATDNFYNHCLSESARLDQQLDGPRGVFTGVQEHRPQSQELHVLVHQIREYGNQFTVKSQHLVRELQQQTDLDCRFLGVRLSFSDYYKQQRREQQAQPHSRVV